MRCMICNGVSGQLKVLTEVGLKTVLQASVQRKDDLRARLDLKNLSQYRFHVKCRASYIKASNIAKCVARLHDEGSLHNFVDVKENDLRQNVSDFPFETCCIICEKSVMKVAKKSVSAISKKAADYLLNVCTSRIGEQWAVDIQARLICPQVLGGRYHHKCYLIFTQNYVKATCLGEPTSSHVSTPSTWESMTPIRPVIDVVSSNVVVDKRAVTSHYQLLRDAAASYGGRMVETVSAGDCFFHALSIALCDNGVQRTIQELRQLAGIELQFNSAIYKPKFILEVGGERQQTQNYEMFVERTWHGHEWATELTICAVATALNMAIRVVSSSGPVSNSSTFEITYGDVASNTLTVLYNAAEGHYLAFRSLSSRVYVERAINAQEVEFIGTSNDIPMQSMDEITDGRFVDAMDISDVVSDIRVDTINVNATTTSRRFVEAMDTTDVVSETHVDVNNMTIHTTSVHESSARSSDINVCVQFDDHICRQCVSCLRCDVGTNVLEIVNFCGKYKKRQFSRVPKAKVGVDVLLCRSCVKYLAEKVGQRQLWSTAWPCVLATMLTNREYASHRTELWSLLPESLRQWWHLVAATEGLDSAEHGMFADYTDECKRFKSLAKCLVPADLLTLMEDFAFPNVKCPAGCFQYIDKCSLLSFNHFLHWQFKVSFFGGDRTMLTGARQDWPSSSIQLDVFRVRPGMVVDENGSLMLMYCESHGNGLCESFVHVPKNPIAKDHGFQCPDTLAAATLTPNVIRAGRMGRWTNSTHVVKAAGGYAGISSSTLACNVDRNVCDERLAMTECLAINHRSDIYHIIRDRYLDDITYSGEAEFNRVLNHFESFYKDSVSRDVNSAMCGATYVDVADCFSIHEQIFKRDSKEDVDIKSWKLSLVFAHPGGPFGSRPVDLHKYYKLMETPLTGAVLHLLIHCPSLHNVLLRAFELNKVDLLRRLLQYIKSCAGRGRNMSKMKNAKACERELCDDLPLSDVYMSKDTCLQVIHLLSSFSKNIHSMSYTFDVHLDKLVFTSTADLVIIYRNKVNRERSDRSLLPNTLNGLYLAIVLGGEHVTDVVNFRWSEAHQFWQVMTDAETNVQTVTTLAQGEFTMGNWCILVYARRRQLTDINSEIGMNINGQRRMWCNIHKLFLVKQPLSCELSCCVKDCSRKARWSCYGKGLTCTHSVCLSHGKRFIAGTDVIHIELRMDGNKTSNAESSLDLPDEDNEDANSVGDELNSESDNEDIHARVLIPTLHEDESMDDLYDIDPRVLAPIGIDDFNVDPDALPPMHSRQDMIPIYDVNRRVPSHLIWNIQYGVMNRGRRFSDVRSNAIIEHIVASTNSASISLLYPEGQLFPRIFWCAKSGSVLGAIPSFMMNTISNKPFGFGSLIDHNFVRLRDGDILTSRESNYWHYLFDVKLNSALNRTSSKLVFKRGLEMLEDSPVSSNNSDLPMDEAESTRRIKELTSLLKKGKWTYFLTITCNDNETPGVREITRAIKRKADGDEKLEKELTDNFLPFVLRVWERFVRFFFQELLLHNDTVIGKVKNIFYRFEFQGAGAVGNKPHVHSGITLYEECDVVSAKRISCHSHLFFNRLFRGDYETLKAEGVVVDRADYERWQDVVSSVNFHDCSAAQHRCMKATNSEGEKICRYHRQPEIPREANSDGVWFSEIPMPYPDDVYELLHEMGLAYRGPNGKFGHEAGEQWFVDESLQAGKWHYSSRPDEFFLSSIPMVSAICRSSTNVDMCDRKFQVSYLVKYISGKEEHQLVDIAGTKKVTEVKATTEDHAHEKISGNRKLVEEKEKKRPHMAREICLAEVMWYNLDLPYTFCNAGFVHLTTLPLENRVGVVNDNRKTSAELSGKSVNDISPVKGRVDAQLEDWRQFSDDQLVHIDDYRNSPYWCDATSAFNVRPPELLVFDDLQVYNECFIVMGTLKSSFTQELGQQRWFNGLSRLVLLRSCSLEKAFLFLSNKAEIGDMRAQRLLDCVFGPLLSGDSDCESLFVHKTDAQQMVSVISLVKPWDKNKFLCHLCLSLGRYVTEVGLFNNGNLLSAFVIAGLFPGGCEITREHVLSLMRRYILEDLRFHPISARQFGKYVTSAMLTLLDLVGDQIVQNYMPCVTNIMLKDQASEELLGKERSRREVLVSALFDDSAIRDMLPAELPNATVTDPVQWTPCILPAVGISDETLVEQNAALQCCVNAIDSFLMPSSRGVKFPCLVGRPGSGKSFCLKLAVAYALSKGLQVQVMSLTSERARKLGGSHLHLVFPFGVSHARIAFSHSYASTCLAQLEKDPLRRALLKRTDVLVFEEIGLLSAEYFSAIDNVLKVIMGNTSPMGGKLFLSSGDFKQLPPINGRPLWSSLNMCTVMKVFIFTCDVRARADAVLQTLNSDCRRTLTAQECRSVARTVVSKCRMVSDWQLIPDEAVRIVSTKAAEMEVVEEFLKERVTQSYRAVDYVQNGATWDRATDRVTQALNRTCYEYEVCKLYVGAVVRMTFNCRVDNETIFSQGQLAIVIRLPLDSTVEFSKQRIRLRLAPPGDRDLTINPDQNQWKEVDVVPRTTLPAVVGRGIQLGRRLQFPVRYHLASTIHRVQGDNVSLLATELSMKNKKYRLWQREQFAVLVSRVRHCSDIIFVGNAADTQEAIEDILSRSSKWDALIEHYLSELNVAGNIDRARQLSLDQHPFLPMYRELPSTVCGYVYMLTSMSCIAPSYIGECMDLHAELRKHNTGYGAEETMNTVLHPWGVYAFVYGFEQTANDDGREKRLDFLQEWRVGVRGWGSAAPDTVFQVCSDVANRWANRTSIYGYVGQLTVVKCGQTQTASVND